MRASCSSLSNPPREVEGGLDPFGPPIREPHRNHLDKAMSASVSPCWLAREYHSTLRRASNSNGGVANS